MGKYKLVLNIVADVTAYLVGASAVIHGILRKDVTQVVAGLILIRISVTTSLP